MLCCKILTQAIALQVGPSPFRFHTLVRDAGMRFERLPIFRPKAKVRRKTENHTKAKNRIEKRVEVERDKER